MKPTGDKKMVSETPRGKKNIRRILTAAACLLLVVALGIAGALPGIGMNYPVYEMNCQFAVHTHDESCYRWENGMQILTCTQADYVIHQHTKECFNVDQETGERSEAGLICPFEEVYDGMAESHEHTSACKTITQSVLACFLDEDFGHQHTDYCFAEGGHVVTRNCPPAHTHDINCYGNEPVQLTLVLNCEEKDEHPYGDEHDGGENKVLTCGKDEGELYLGDDIHTHRFDCWSEDPVLCEHGNVHTAECGWGEDCRHVISHIVDYNEDECVLENGVCTNEEHYEITRHPDECYELICGAEEHTHDDELCYETAAREYERSGHTHGFSRKLLAAEIDEKYPYAAGRVNTVVILDDPDADISRTYYVSDLTEFLEDRDCLEEYPDTFDDPGCYALEPVAPDCGLEEHVHTIDNCGGEYESKDGLLLCAKEASSFVHEHDDSCYKTVTVYGCVKQTQAHTHGPACQDEQGNLVCGLLELSEVAEHQHTTDGCLLEVTPPDDDSQGDGTGTTDGKGGEDDTDDETGLVATGEYLLLGKNAVDVTLYYIDPNNNSNKVEITDDAMLGQHLNDYFAIDVRVKDPVIVADLKNNHYTIRYLLEDYFKLEPAKEAYRIGNQEVGWIESVPADETHGNMVILTFSEGYLDGMSQINNLTFSIGGEFDLEEIAKGGGNGKILGRFTVTVTDDGDAFLAQYSSLKLDKKVHTAYDKRINKQNPLQTDRAGNYFVEYTVTASAGKYGYPGVVVTDAFTNSIEEQQYWFAPGPDKQTVTKVRETSNIIYTISGDTYVRGEQDIHEDNFVPNGNPPDEPVGFAWNIGDMASYEERTLTYRVYLNKAVVDKNKGYTMGNKAAAYSTKVDGDTPEAVASAEIKAGATASKRGMPTENLESGGASIEYRVLIQANTDNQHDLDLILTDTLNTTQNEKLLKYLSFDLNKGLKVYRGDYYTKIDGKDREIDAEPLRQVKGEIEWSGLPTDSAQNLWLKIYDMAPDDEPYTLVYTVNVSPEAYTFDNYKETSKTFNIQNRLTLSTQELEERPAVKLMSVAQINQNTGTAAAGLTGQQISEKVYDTQLTKKKWAEKILSNPEYKEKLEFDIADDAVIYSFDEETGKLKSEPDTADENTKRIFDIDHSCYPYTVKVNAGGVWNVDSWTMKDTLDQSDNMANKHSPHMEYVGYVKVTGTRTGADGKPETKTVWVNVDQMVEFSFSGSALGFDTLTDSNWAYELTYYTQPKNLDKMLEVHFGNSFDLNGTGGTGSGSWRRGFNVQVENTLAGTLSFEGRKRAWYYAAPDYTSGEASDGAPGNNKTDGKGAFYWVLEVKSGDTEEEIEGRIPAGVELVDKVTGGSHQFPYPRSGEIVIDAFIAEPGIDFESFESYDKFMETWGGGNGAVKRLTEGTETITKGPDGEDVTVSEGDYLVTRDENTKKSLRIRFLNDVVLNPDTERLYFVIRTVPTALPGEDPIQYKNALYLSAKDELGYELFQDDDVISLPGSKGLEKRSGTLFYANGKGDNDIVKNKDGKNEKGSDDAEFMAEQYWKGSELVNLEPGMYATWLVDTNIHGDLLGEFEVRDRIPDGMELVSVALYDIENYDADQTIGSENQRMPTPGTISGLEPLRSGPSNGAFSDWENWSYYIRTIDGEPWAAWRVNWSHYGAKDKYMGANDDPYTVTFAVICRITDEDVLLGDNVDGDVLEGGSELTNDAAYKKTFTNTAYLYKIETGWEKNDPFDTAEASRDIEYKAQIVKSMPLKSDATVDCTIEVNPYAMRLNKEGDGFEVIDIMSKNIELKDSSITITVFDDAHPSGCAIEEIEELNWKRTDNLIITETKDGNPVLRITLPDSKRIEVKYTIRVNAEPNTEVTVRNVAFYAGHYATPDGVEQSSKFKIKMDLNFTISDTKIKLVKQSSLTHEPLEGAEFTLTKAEYKDGELVKVADDPNPLVGKTDEKGELVFEKIQPYTLYCLEETRAPSEYLAREPEFIAFVYQLSPKYWNFADTATALETAGKLSVYRLDPKEPVRELPTIYNSRGEIQVTKKFLKQGGDENGMDPTVIPKGDYKFGLYQKDENGSMVPVPNPKTNEDYIIPITVPEANTTDYVFFAKFENLLPGTYYVFELDTKGNRLENNGSWELESKVFVTEYKGEEEGIVLADPDPDANADAEGGTGTSSGKSMAGEVVVTNTMIQSYRLPRTGGEGFSTVLYMAGGLMIVGVGLLLAMKKRMKGQQ